MGLAPRRSQSRFLGLIAASSAIVATLVAVPSGETALASGAHVKAGEVVRVVVPEAIGGKTVVGQLTVDDVSRRGFVTAYGCADGIPRHASGDISRSDLNYNGAIAPVWSNRLIVQADADGYVCFYTHQAANLIVDVNAVSHDTGISSFDNRRTDTRLRGPRPPAGHILRLSITEARGAKTVIGQLTVDGVTERGFVTAFGCAEGLPRDSQGRISKSDLNFDGRVTPVWSNRLVAQADEAGELCLYTLRTAHLIVDINGVADSGIESFANRRIDSRDVPSERLQPGQTREILVPEAVGRKTVLGQLTTDRASQRGFITAYPCSSGPPRNGRGEITRSDLNFNGRVSPVRSNRLIVQADARGRVCFYAHRATDLIVDINGVSDTGIFSFPNRRTDTRNPASATILPAPPNVEGVPVWPHRELLGSQSGTAALTGRPVSASVTRRPIVSVKIDNFRLARPQWGLERADAVFEMNVEGMTRFIALFQTHQPVSVGPVRSARTADLDLVQSMNRPVFAFSGANPGVTAWVQSAASSGGLVDFSAMHQGCYRRVADRRAPHNLVLDTACAVSRARHAGPAAPLWSIDRSWAPTAATTSSGRFTVPMDGVAVEWSWNSSARHYVRFQDSQPHMAASGSRIVANNVVVLESVHRPSVVDARSPHPQTIGSGRGVLHRNGRAIPITWSRSDAFGRFEFIEARSGRLVALDEGITFVSLRRPF